MASVGVGISCTGRLGGNRAYLLYPSGPSQHSNNYSPRSHRIHTCTVSITIFSLVLLAQDSCCFECCVKKINDLSFFLSHSAEKNVALSHQPDIFHKDFSNFLGSPITKPKFSRLETILEIIVFQQLWKVEFGNYFMANNQIMIIFSITYGLKGVV